MTAEIPAQRVEWCWIHRAVRASTPEAQVTYCWRWPGGTADKCVVTPALIVATEVES